MGEVTSIPHKQRWDYPFGGAMSEADVDRVLALPMFREIDGALFPLSLPFRDIIRNDARLVHYPRSDIVVRAGDYGNSFFVILQGTARVVLDESESGLITRGPRSAKPSFFRILGQLWRNSRFAEARDVSTYQADQGVSLRSDADVFRTYLDDIEACIRSRKTQAIGVGDSFGEIAALSRSPRAATVFAESDLVVVEIRWQGLRDLRRWAPDLRASIDASYREKRLEFQLRDSPLFANLPVDVVKKIARETLFESHGKFEWLPDYKRVEEREFLGQEAVIAEEGTYLDGLLLICSGFGRVSQKVDQGERTVGYLRANELFGLEELVRAIRLGEAPTSRLSLRAIGYVDALRIPTKIIEEHVLPNAPAKVVAAVQKALDSSTAEWAPMTSDLDQSMFDFFVDNRIVNGRASMLINMSRCVGCDDCVRACAAAHDNNPRFVRHGLIHGNIQVANACMHCTDAVCLIGCPTGSIARNRADGRIMIDDPTCVGCGTCAESCPYDNIRLVEIRDADGRFIVDKKTNAPIRKATKCDLCYGQLGGPACQRACPHDALIRIDMQDTKELVDWIKR